MKKIYIEDINRIGNLTLFIGMKDMVYSVQLCIEHSFFQYKGTVFMCPDDVNGMFKSYNRFLNGESELMIWETSLLKFKLSRHDLLGNIDCSLDIIDGQFYGHFIFNFSEFQLRQVDIADVDFIDCINDSENKLCFNIIENKHDDETADFNLLYQNNKILINKPFWVYFFELKDMCVKINKYIRTEGIVDISVPDSYLWATLNPGGIIKLEVRNLEFPYSFVKYSFDVPISILESVCQYLEKCQSMIK